MHEGINKAHKAPLKAEQVKNTEAPKKGEKPKGILILRSFKAALLLAWNAKRLGELEEQVKSYRGQISLRLMVLLNIYQGLQSQRLEELQESNQVIVEVLSVGYETLRLNLDEKHHQYTRLAHADKDDAERRHTEVIAAILTTREGQSSTIACLQPPDNLLKESVRHGQNFATRTFRGYQNLGVSPPTEPNSSSNADIAKLTNSILDALEFREMTERHSTISKAYDYTFEWIFNETDDKTVKWANFTQWLESGNGCYWINGKAGSGKSTLMKYIASHPSTSAALKKWAGSDHLLMGTFFFWYAGTTLQRSQTGLLRSLLLAVLHMKPELVPILFPNVLRSLLTGRQQLPLQLTLVELKRAFITLMDTDLCDMKMCFLVDGLDEYDGDHDDLADMFFQATKSPRVKILTSSRPIPACVYAFRNCPQLRLQDLTHDDIFYFAENELRQNPIMKRLETARNGTRTELVEGIVSKASGVFLWVAVVVKMLMRGLRDYDTISDLRHKLDVLPEELEHLYHHMLLAMSKANRVQGSKFLQLLLHSSKTHASFPMTLLQLSYAEEEDYERCFDDEPTTMPKQDEIWRLESTEGRLRSRCCGLIEAQDNPQREKAASTVGFLHRTVVEFLEDANNWNELTSWTAGGKFDTTLALLSSSISEMKAKILPREFQQDETLAFQAVARILTYEATMASAGQKLCRTKFHPEVQKTLFNLWREDPSGRCSRNRLNSYTKLVVTAAYHCSEKQLKPLLDVLDCPGLLPSGDRNSPAQIVAFLLSEYVDETRVHVRSSIARGISNCRADPNEDISFDNVTRRYWNDRFKLGIHTIHTAGWTHWEFLLHYIHECTTNDFRRLFSVWLLDTVFDLIIAMLQGGGHLRTGITLMRNDRFHRSSNVHNASEVIGLFCCKAWDIKDSRRSTLTPNESCGTLAGQQLMDVAALAEKITQIETLFNIQSHRDGSEGHDTRHSNTAGKSNTSFDPSATDWSSSPWRSYQANSSTSRSKHRSPSAGPARQKDQGEIRWKTTRHSDRLHLLDGADQELVRRLCARPSPREERQMLSGLSKRTQGEQEKIFQCVEQLKKVK